MKIGKVTIYHTLLLLCRRSGFIIFCQFHYSVAPDVTTGVGVAKATDIKLFLLKKEKNKTKQTAFPTQPENKKQVVAILEVRLYIRR